MKKYLIPFFISFAVIIYSGCANQAVTEPDSATSTNGRISLSIDKKNTPAGITEIAAILTRSGHANITRTLNLLSDTTAGITVDSLTVGSWHLTVQARDKSGTVKYSGETDVNVMEGIITYVSLTLNPVSSGSGTGSISIMVKWGQYVSCKNWYDYGYNPIASPEDFGLNTWGLSEGKVLYDNGKYKMWYNAVTKVFDQSGSFYYVCEIAYAESMDGIKWYNVTSDPLVLKKGNLGSWDDYLVGVYAVIKDSSRYLMYYTALKTGESINSIGLAISSDGIHWTKSAQPVFKPEGAETNVCVSGIVKKGNKYFMLYSYAPDLKIKLAISNDGVNWTRYSDSPVLSNDKAWESSGIIYPSVIVENGKFKMVYGNNARNAFGMAYSDDGVNWIKESNNPIFELADVKYNWTDRIQYPCYLKASDGNRIYYSGYIYNPTGYGNREGVIFEKK